ncbi:MAG: RHS repeat-associated core domain-containing protein [Limisphaerales bacterium]
MKRATDIFPGLKSALALANSSGSIVESYVYDAYGNVTIKNSGGNVISTSAYGNRFLLANTVLALANSSGSIVESYNYDAYGNVTIKNSGGNVISTSAYGNRFLFQGREYDYTTQLYHFRARWYDPETGRWLSNDPIGISGGLNLYAFCSNDPVNFVDPMGEKVYRVCTTTLGPLNLHEVIVGDDGKGGYYIIQFTGTDFNAPEAGRLPFGYYYKAKGDISYSSDDNKSAAKCIEDSDWKILEVVNTSLTVDMMMTNTVMRLKKKG